jgi:phasin family protein
MKANTNSTLDFAQDLLGAKSPSEAMELWTARTRKNAETLSAQAKELVELSQRVAKDTIEPIKTSATKLYKPAAA